MGMLVMRLGSEGDGKIVVEVIMGWYRVAVVKIVVVVVGEW